MTKGASSDHGLTALLRHNKLQPGQDVKVLYLGGVREALAAPERGIVAASVLSAPTTLVARRLGYKELVNITDHPKAANADPKEFFDNHFLKELEDSGFIQELYGRR